MRIPTGDQAFAGLTPLGRQHSFVAIDHEMFSMVNDPHTNFLKKFLNGLNDHKAPEKINSSYRTCTGRRF